MCVLLFGTLQKGKAATDAKTRGKVAYATSFYSLVLRFFDIVFSCVMPMFTLFFSRRYHVLPGMGLWYARVTAH